MLLRLEEVEGGNGPTEFPEGLHRRKPDVRGLRNRS